MQFTPQQLNNWRAFESVRESGAFNMLDPRAQLVSMIPKDEYRFVLSNYDALKAAVNAERNPQ